MSKLEDGLWTRHLVPKSWSSPRESQIYFYSQSLIFDRCCQVVLGKPPVREAPLLLRCHLVASAEERIPSDE